MPRQAAGPRWCPLPPAPAVLVACGHPPPAEISPSTVIAPRILPNHIYWDIPYRPDTYNPGLAMNRFGFDTLTVDRRGTGSTSDRRVRC